ncbi:hypothetical protein C6366_03580 [Desulfonatronum sp. SC1]|nr:hypothetical protein C6366_03580 [Desulfonatronum sp. SC1]
MFPPGKAKLTYSFLRQSSHDSSFKNPKSKEQEKIKVEANFFIRESLIFLRRRGNWEFFNGLLVD